MSAPDEPLTFASGDLTLEALLHRPQTAPHPAVAVCHPHPLFGGDMHNSVVVAVCQALVDAGIGALRFNFRGVGRSQGGFGDGIGEREDVLAALGHLRGLGGVDPAKMGIVGYSFGAAVSLLAADAGISALVAISPPSLGSTIPALAVRCPALLITGDLDDVAPPASVRVLADTLGSQCQVEVVPGADHFWWDHEEKLAQTVAAFLRDVLVSSP